MNFIVPIKETSGLLKDSIRTALQSITGSRDILSAKAEKVEQMLQVLPFHVASSVLSRAVDSYDGAKTYPTTPFWKRLVSEEIRAQRKKEKLGKILSGESEYVKPEGAEKEFILQQCRDTAEKYTTKKSDNNINIVKNRRARMINHLKNKEVLITDPDSHKFDCWVPKSFAEENGIRHYSPDHYLSDAKDSGRFGTISI